MGWIGRRRRGGVCGVKPSGRGIAATTEDAQQCTEVQHMRTNIHARKKTQTLEGEAHTATSIDGCVTYLHLQEADLVEAAGEDVDDVAVLHRLVGQPVIKLARRLVRSVLGGIDSIYFPAPGGGFKIQSRQMHGIVFRARAVLVADSSLLAADRARTVSCTVFAHLTASSSPRPSTPVSTDDVTRTPPRRPSPVPRPSWQSTAD